MNIQCQNVLVTGGAGFIGSHIVDALLKKGCTVRIIDDMSSGNISNLQQWNDDRRLEIIKGDVRDPEAIKDALKDIDIVFHEAAKVSVPISVRDPVLVMDVNVRGTVLLLDACRKKEVKKVIVASSSSVYGNTPTLPKIETMQTKPLSPYAVSKLAQETLTIAFYNTYGLETTALRYFNVYGPRQRGGSYAGVISIFIRQALSGIPLTIEGDGKQSRDFTFIEDVVAANLLAAESSKSSGRVYNVGGGNRITIEELANYILSLTCSKSPKEYVEPRAGDVRDSLASLEKIQKDLGYSPSTDILTGLEKTIEWEKDIINNK